MEPRKLLVKPYKGRGRHPWRWRLVAGNGAVIADGAEGYKTKRNLPRARSIGARTTARGRWRGEHHLDRHRGAERLLLSAACERWLPCAEARQLPDDAAAARKHVGFGLARRPRTTTSVRELVGLENCCTDGIKASSASTSDR